MKDVATIAHTVTPLLGVSTGLRSFTPLASTAWFARSGKLPVEGTWASAIEHPAAVGILTVAAVGECIADKLPNAPDRTLPVAVVGRVVFGGLVGAVVATALRRPHCGWHRPLCAGCHGGHLRRIPCAALAYRRSRP